MQSKRIVWKEFKLQIYLEDCTGCGLCNKICPAISKEDKNKKAIMLTPKQPRLDAERKNIEFFETIPYSKKNVSTTTMIRDAQYLQPYFEFSGACAGCGETPYVKLVSQLFGDRMLVANATGCSSIYGGCQPTTPWTANEAGHGPAWSNSLFEDNAEFGYGFRLAEDKQQELAIEFLKQLADQIGSDLVTAITNGITADDEKEVAIQRQNIEKLKTKLAQIKDPRAKHLTTLARHLIKKAYG